MTDPTPIMANLDAALASIREAYDQLQAIPDYAAAGEALSIGSQINQLMARVQITYPAPSPEE